MKIWYAIRRPLGILLLTGVIYLTLIVLHAIPVLLASAILGVTL